MKRFLSVFLVLALVLTPVFSLATDYSSFSDDDLFKEVNVIMAELTKRELNANNVLFDSGDGFTVYFDGEPTVVELYDGSHGLEINLISVNSGDKEVSLSCMHMSVNGWKVNPMFSTSLKSGEKVKTKIQSYTFEADTGMKSLDEIETIEFFCNYKADGEYVFMDESCAKLVLK